MIQPSLPQANSPLRSTPSRPGVQLFKHSGSYVSPLNPSDTPVLYGSFCYHGELEQGSSRLLRISRPPNSICFLIPAAFFKMWPVLGACPCLAYKWNWQLTGYIYFHGGVLCEGVSLTFHPGVGEEGSGGPDCQPIRNTVFNNGNVFVSPDKRTIEGWECQLWNSNTPSHEVIFPHQGPAVG